MCKLLSTRFAPTDKQASTGCHVARSSLSGILTKHFLWYLIEAPQIFVGKKMRACMRLAQQHPSLAILIILQYRWDQGLGKETLTTMIFKHCYAVQ